ncbi:hypothetical protein GTU79_09135 [Sodalis ligni]|jgi:hypothetical protein|uniref:Uncharacterized protein n=1 Tax=Sodalis ligni TaxID=2697027 RepID=A0A4R1N8J7_9GAMM|nr:hypothetical protein [Sodalis ligni]QWA12817.1 hypothetical protein GTU79_09135 [Sodalis ligni]TCL03654.1 hypothetical protein EZJ58_1731 [Sodalis ligni]
MTLFKKSLIVITCTLGALSFTGMAAAPAGTPSAAPADTSPAAPAGWQNQPRPEPGPMFFHHPGGPMMMRHGPGFCHGGEVFCASVQSDNPGETIQKLNTILPAPAAGSHYEVRLSVVKVPNHFGDNAPDGGETPHPANGG